MHHLELPLGVLPEDIGCRHVCFQQASCVGAHGKRG